MVQMVTDYRTTKKRKMLSRDMTFNEEKSRKNRLNLGSEIDEVNEEQFQVIEPEESETTKHEEQESAENETTAELSRATSKGGTIRTPSYLDDYVMLTYTEAINENDGENWRKAVENEKQSLMENKTWEVLDKR